MPIGKNGQSPSNNGGLDRPVVFQKYFKSGGRTFAAQVKVAVNGRKYLVLTEGVRNPDTRELKKHYIRVHDQDLKSFFAMLQEVVVYLRSNRSNDSIAGVVATGPAAPVQPQAPAAVAARPARTPAAVKPTAKVAVKPQATAKPVQRNGGKPPVQVGKSPKPGYRPAAARSR